jgi:hypothetical protein
MSLLVTIPINQQKKINIFQGSHGKYYTINNNDSTLNESTLNESTLNESTLNEEILKYDIHFPIAWAEDDTEYILNEIQCKVGPKYCANCIEYGFYNGVFIGYCANCALLLDYSRGNGLLSTGEEVSQETVAFDISFIKKENSIWNTYLLYSNKEEIGDTLLKENYEMYKDLPPLLEIDE